MRLEIVRAVFVLDLTIPMMGDVVLRMTAYSAEVPGERVVQTPASMFPHQPCPITQTCIVVAREHISTESNNTTRCGSTSAFCGVGNCQSGACTGATTTTTSTVSTT